MNTYRELFFERISARFIYEPLSGQLIRRLSNGKIRELMVAREGIGEDRFVVADVAFNGYLIKDHSYHIHADDGTLAQTRLSDRSP